MGILFYGTNGDLIIGYIMSVKILKKKITVMCASGMNRRYV